MEYFAKIDEQKKLRINLMLAAKESILAFSTLEQLEDIRQRKINLIAELKEDFKDASASCKALSELISDEKTRKAILDSYKTLKLKESHLKVPPVVAPKSKTKEIKEAKAKETDAEEPLPIAVKKKTDVDRLEYTLSMIEQKLADLSKE
jgi:hypothetical protein